MATAVIVCELKICEGCGRQWMRGAGSKFVLCTNCEAQMRAPHPEAQNTPERNRVRLIEGPKRGAPKRARSKK